MARAAPTTSTPFAQQPGAKRRGTSTRSSYIGQHYDNVTATFVYDGDGRRVKGTVNGVTTVIVGDHYEVRTDGEGEVTREYYRAASPQRSGGDFAGSSSIAVRELPSGKLSWLITDHLGSISAVADSAGVLTAEVRYRAFGDVRYVAGILVTSIGYTGQRAESLLGLDDYRARWFDPTLARFAQADTMVPGAGPMAWDRYAYGLSNPLRYSDPTGHRATEGCGTSSLCNLPRPRDARATDGKSNREDPSTNSRPGLLGLACESGDCVLSGIGIAASFVTTFGIGGEKGWIAAELVDIGVAGLSIARTNTAHGLGEISKERQIALNASAVVGAVPGSWGLGVSIANFIFTLTGWPP